MCFSSAEDAKRYYWVLIAIEEVEESLHNWELYDEKNCCHL
jgi:hypothetical protein